MKVLSLLILSLLCFLSVSNTRNQIVEQDQAMMDGTFVSDFIIQAMKKKTIMSIPSNQIVSEYFRLFDITIDGRKIGSLIKSANDHGYIDIIINNNGIAKSDINSKYGNRVIVDFPLAFSTIENGHNKVLGLAFEDGDQKGWLVQPNRLEGMLIVRADGSYDIFNKSEINLMQFFGPSINEIMKEKDILERISDQNTLKPFGNFHDLKALTEIVRRSKYDLLVGYLVIYENKIQFMKTQMQSSHVLCLDQNGKAAFLKMEDGSVTNNDAIAVAAYLGFRKAILCPIGGEDSINSTNRVVFYDKTS